MRTPSIYELNKAFNLLKICSNYKFFIHRCIEQDATLYQTVAISCFGVIQCSGIVEVRSEPKPQTHQKLLSDLTNNIGASKNNRHIISVGKFKTSWAE